MDYVIIGASAAGMSAVRAVKERDRSAHITVVSDERPYYRPMIPLLVSGERQQDEIGRLDGPEHYGAEFVAARVTGVDTSARTLAVSDGNSIGYDRLLIATGSRAHMPEIQGIKGEGVFAFRTSADAVEINRHASNAKNAVVIGCGFAGTKAAEALARKGIKVTVLEAAPDILTPRLDPKGAGIIRSALESGGITIRTSDTASAITRDGGGVRAVECASGDTLEAELVVVAVGTEPNMDFLQGSGVKTDLGVVTSGNLETDAEGVYAAGDAAQSSDIQTGKAASCALWSTAVEMGRIAGCNMAGGKLEFPGLLAVRNASEIAGVPVISVGRVADADREAVCGKGERLHRYLSFNGDVLEGAVFMGELRGAGLYANLIKNRIPLTAGQKRKAVDDMLGYADFAATV